jgi:hypothetical protein
MHESPSAFSCQSLALTLPSLQRGKAVEVEGIFLSLFRAGKMMGEYS